MSIVLLTWLHAPNSREARTILETHRELLDFSSDVKLQQMITDVQASPAHVNVTGSEFSQKMREFEKLRNHLYLLQDIRERGGTLRAIRSIH